MSDLLTAAEAAAELRCHEKTVRRMMAGARSTRTSSPADG